MARSQVELNGFSNVTAGNTATLQLPLGRTYDHIMVSHTGVTLAQIKNIRVEVNGKAIQTFKDAQELQDLNKYYGRNCVAGIFDFHFKQPEMKTLAEQRMFSLGTASLKVPAQNQAQADQAPAIQVVSLVMDIDAAAAAPALKAMAVQSDPVPFGSIVKVKRFPKSISAGINEFDTIPRPVSARIKAIHVKTAATLKSVKLMIDNTEVTQLEKVFAEKLQVGAGRTPQAGYTANDFTLEGDMLQAIPMVGIQDMRLVIEAADDTGASTYSEVIVEYLDTLSGI